MSDYNWCHGPSCHKRVTTTRVRGVKGSKVLRTIKIPVSGYRSESIWKYFCDQTCMHDFIRTYIEEFAQLHPRPEALETPIDVVKVPREDWRGNPYVETRIHKVVDNA